MKRSIPREPADPPGLQIPVPSRNWLCFPAKNRSRRTLLSMQQWFKRQRYWLCLALFWHPPGTGCVLSCRCGMSPAAMRSVKAAPAVAILQFHKVCVFVTIPSHRPCLSSTTRAAGCTRNALHIRGSGRGPESLCGLSKSERGIRISLSYDRISRLCHRRRPGLSGLGPETHDPLGQPGSLNAL